MRKIKANILVVVFAAILAIIGFVSPKVSAVQASTSEGFTTKASLSDGALVSLEANNYQAVQMATVDNRSLLAGVAVKPERALVAITDGSNKVQVVSSGSVALQVSTANGAIRAGDVLTVSPISGVAMKATSAGRVIGVAQQDFSADPGEEKSPIELTNSNNQKEIVQVGKIVVNVSIEDWSPGGQPNSPILNNLRNFLGNAAGRPVSNSQAVISMGIMILAVFASGTILYSAVSSSIHSIGRNPLSKGIIRRSLFVMLSLSTIVIIGAVSAVFLILGG